MKVRVAAVVVVVVVVVVCGGGGGGGCGRGGLVYLLRTCGLVLDLTDTRQIAAVVVVVVVVAMRRRNICGDTCSSQMSQARVAMGAVVVVVVVEDKRLGWIVDEQIATGQLQPIRLPFVELWLAEVLYYAFSLDRRFELDKSS